jgi:alkylhydroperoxidase/carboxymuconolactone decarboxylase family protein YurZ
MPDREEILRRLTLGDVTCLDSLVDDRRKVGSTPALDYVGEALVKLGALIVTDGSDVTWHHTVAAALDAGLTADQVVDALVVLAPVIGGTRVVAVAPKLALATGFDVAAALELP